MRDDDATARVRARVAERIELRPGAADRLVARLLAGADVKAGVVEVAGVDLIPSTSAPIAREDSVPRGVPRAAVVRARGGQVCALEAPSSDLAAAVAAVPPDLVACIASAAEEITRGQVLHPNVVCLPDHDAVEPEPSPPARRAKVLRGGIAAASRRAGPGSVDDDGVSVHAADPEARRRDQDRCRKVRPPGGTAAEPRLVVAGADEDPITGPRGIHRGLNRVILPADSVVAPDSQHPGVGS